MSEISNAIIACMVDRRWQDLPAVLQVYARGMGMLEPAHLFNGAIAHRLVRYAMTLTDPAQFDECVAAIADRVEAVRTNEPLAVSIQGHRTAHEHAEAFRAFDALTILDKGVH